MPLSGTSLNLIDAAHAIDGRLRPFADELQGIAPDLLHRCLSCLDLDRDIPAMLVHGDFVPWNIRKTSEIVYVLVDWEWADFSGLPMQDERRLCGHPGIVCLQRVFKANGSRHGTLAAVRNHVSA
jgi:hypothetical protein